MDERLSSLSAIRTDRIVRTVPNRDRQHKGQQREFESHLKPDAEEQAPPVNEETSETAPGTPSSASPHRGQVMDFTA